MSQAPSRRGDMLLALFRVPKSIVGLAEDSTYASVVAASLNFILRTIRPKRTQRGQVLTEKLGKRFDPRIVIYYEDSSPEDPQQKNADLKQDYECGILTPNEYRVKRGLEPYKFGGDDPIVGGEEKNWATGKEPEPPPQPPGMPQPGASPEGASPEEDAADQPGPRAPKGGAEDSRTQPPRRPGLPSRNGQHTQEQAA